MKISLLKPNPSNPRVIKDDKFDKLVSSIRNFPKMMELRPIIIDENNVIQGGNMRYKALIQLGYKDVPDSWVKQGKALTPEQWAEFVIKDNVGFGEWDFDMLANEWDENEIESWGLDIPNFDNSPDDKDEKKDISTTLIVECGDAAKLSILFSELQDRGFVCKLKE